MATKYPSEDREQVLLAAWLDLNGFVWCHVPNELVGKIGRARGAIEKRKGIKAGVPDVLIFSGPRGQPLPEGVRGIAIELKRRGRGNVASTAQKRWLAKLRASGWRTAVTKGARVAEKFVREVLRDGASRPKPE